MFILGHVGVVEVLLRRGAHPSLQDGDGDTPIHDAVTKKRDDIIRLLIDANADLTITNNNGFNPLHHAALRGNARSVPVVFMLIEASFLIYSRSEDIILYIN